VYYFCDCIGHEPRRIVLTGIYILLVLKVFTIVTKICQRAHLYSCFFHTLRLSCSRFRIISSLSSLISVSSAMLHLVARTRNLNNLSVVATSNKTSTPPSRLLQVRPRCVVVVVLLAPGRQFLPNPTSSKSFRNRITMLLYTSTKVVVPARPSKTKHKPELS
jgi:hypothetical protein